MTDGVEIEQAPKPIGWYNDRLRYGHVSRLLHWGMALLILGSVALGLYSGSLTRGDPVRDAVLEVHKSIGLLLLGLVIVRIVWLGISPRPSKPSDLKRWEMVLSGFVQTSLYALMLAMPLTGILLSQSAGRSIDFFGIFTLPQLLPVDTAVPPTQRLGVIAGAIFHKNVLELMLYLLLALHVAGFAKHHFMERKPHLLRRIWGR
jgi:cytochrome b561